MANRMKWNVSDEDEEKQESAIDSDADESVGYCDSMLM